jgi:hypothetical protein
MLEARPLAAKPWYWWRPVDGARAKARGTEAGLVGGRHSELLELRPWLGVGNWALALGSGAGMPAASSGGDRGCARVDSPSLRSADKASVDFAWDTGHPLTGR